jgi:Tol biopolymer transport system component
MRLKRLSRKSTRSSIPLVLVIGMAAVVCAASALQNSSQYKVLFEKAKFTMETKGDLKGAIGLFEEIIKNYPNERDYAAKSQLYVGLCYEKLGQEQGNLAQKAFEKVVENYPEQAEAVKLANEKLITIFKRSAPKDETEQGTRKVLEGRGVGMDFYGTVSPDGRYISGPDWEKDGNVAIRDLKTGDSRCLTEDKGGSAYDIKWSADGKELTYCWVNWEDVASSELKTTRVDGTGTRAIWSAKGKYVVPFAWAPDGKQILAGITADKTVDLSLISVRDGSVQVLKSYPITNGSSFGGCVFSPDGRYIAYSRAASVRSNENDIFLLSLPDKKEITLVTHPANEYLLGWSADGHHVYFASDRTGSIGLWAVPWEEGVSERNPLLIRDHMGPIIPVGLTRDGSFYYGYQSRWSDIYVAEIDPESGRVLSDARKVDLPFEGHNRDPHYSPDGEHLAYISDRGVFRNLYHNVLSIHTFRTGSNRDFDLNSCASVQPRWSPDGRTILTAGSRKAGPWEWAIYRTEIDKGTTISAVPPNEVSDVYSHGWSPDGRSVFYLNAIAVKKGSTLLSVRILERSLETGGEREIAAFESINSSHELFDVSPNGKTLAFVKRDLANERDGINIISAAGGAPHEIYAMDLSKGLVDYLVWSPDGHSVVCSVSDRSSRKSELMRIPAEGGQPQKMGLSMSGVSQLSIRPDGRQIAIASGGSKVRTPEIWVMENMLPEAGGKGKAR